MYIWFMPIKFVCPYTWMLKIVEMRGLMRYKAESSIHNHSVSLKLILSAPTLF